MRDREREIEGERERNRERDSPAGTPWVLDNMSTHNWAHAGTDDRFEKEIVEAVFKVINNLVKKKCK